MNLDPNQSKINAVKARITQIETSELFSEPEKERLLSKLNVELEELSNPSPNDIKVNNPEII